MSQRFQIMRRGLLALVAALFSVGTATAQSWIQLAPSGGPPSGRYESTAVYDPATSQMIVFGGSAFGTDNNEAWTLSLSASPSWTQLSPAGSLPSPRVGAKAVYDPVNARMTVFGGGLGNTSPCTNELWTLSNANSVSGTPTWTQLSPSGSAPSPRWESSAIYDPTTNRMTVFGGNDCFSGLSNDVWVLSNANGLGGTPSWMQLAPAGTPPAPSAYQTAVYDPSSNRMIAFGVQASGNPSGQVWVLTNANGLGGTPSWIQLAPAGPAVPARINQGAVYNAQSNQMIVFGGGSTSGDLNDVWVLANANGLGGTPTWSQLNPSGALPAVREGFPAVFDPIANRMVIFGGVTPGTYYNDAWVLQFSSDDDSQFSKLNGDNTFTGNQTVNGTVAATSFVGNGTGLTGVAAATANIANFANTANFANAANVSNTAGFAANAGVAANASSLGNVPAASYARLDVGNNFAGNQTLTGDLSASGNLTTTGSVKIGGGTAITEHLSMTITNPIFRAVNPLVACATFPLLGASDGDTVAVGVANSREAGGVIFYFAWVSAANTIKICKLTASAPTTVLSGVIRVDIWKH